MHVILLTLREVMNNFETRGLHFATALAVVLYVLSDVLWHQQENKKGIRRRRSEGANISLSSSCEIGFFFSLVLNCWFYCCVSAYLTSPSIYTCMCDNRFHFLSSFHCYLFLLAHSPLSMIWLNGRISIFFTICPRSTEHHMDIRISIERTIITWPCC